MQIEKEKKKAIKLTPLDIVELMVGGIILLTLFSIKYVFPNNPFVNKWFSGFSGFALIVVFFICIYIYDLKIRKKRK